ncbi:MAG TPA: GerMN domain-containing protein [Spirochaetia bacterium]|nr:GerMN domain-containing protein [Spirochaetia bacterium]
MAAKRSSRAKSSNLRSRGIGCLFWICLLAIIVAVGYVARAQIADTFSRLFGGKQQTGAVQQQPHVTTAPLPPGETPARDSARDAAPPAGAPTSGMPAAPGAPEGKTVVQTPPAQPPEKPALRKTRLFFISVDPNGKILMKGVIRPIPQSDSPLHDALETLLKGPTSQEINLGLMTMVPSGTILRGVTVKGDTAFVDFSESFRFNSLGIEGMTAQLRQVVYAATDFPTVKKVQILIEGKKVVYLGTEGVRIDQPLARSSFAN